ncbi:unnamed protein product [Urochloa humidicola]
MAKDSAAVCSLLVLVLLGLGSQMAQSQVLFKGFNGESWKKQGGWYNYLRGQVDDITVTCATLVWLPPPSHPVAPQGYMPDHLYNLAGPAL